MDDQPGDFGLVVRCIHTRGDQLGRNEKATGEGEKELRETSDVGN